MPGAAGVTSEVRSARCAPSDCRHGITQGPVWSRPQSAHRDELLPQAAHVFPRMSTSLLIVDLARSDIDEHAGRMPWRSNSSVVGRTMVSQPAPR